MVVIEDSSMTRIIEMRCKIMEMEHINENTIRVLIENADLEERGITFLDLFRETISKSKISFTAF